MTPPFKLALGSLLAICALVVLLLPGCAGIPDAIQQPKVKPCEVWVNDVCLSQVEFQRWRQRMGL